MFFNALSLSAKKYDFTNNFAFSKLFIEFYKLFVESKIICKKDNGVKTYNKHIENFT
jgi:hypothetical protein